MTQPESAEAGPRLTARGLATRARILDAADDLMYAKGVAQTTLADVRAASGTSKSQLYQHFVDKDALVREVISQRTQRLLEHQQKRLRRLDSLRGLELWADSLVQRNSLHDGAYGCPLGSMASELADQDEDARRVLAAAFQAWQALLVDGLERMRENGTLRPDADPKRLAAGLMAALQGGYLLAQTTRDVEPMRVALDMAISHVRTFGSA
ncbi:TetR/AcrR family transcriptional regulator [Kribbella sp. CA-293567]|uniref:TetR/AcrR family transcriptional regulator n=1 Tax=Kribbella sp. CA-293567 TaxID=3002436 RepID=UPI0022DE7F62|nr:TetR/AcrR family transcriptional regulator [Kribbella sp. CA-293567]WBQ08394.1 TetR family transcriptional regulator C-terminal domain-containing protein [Kribbella sp. CA-293567]